MNRPMTNPHDPEEEAQRRNEYSSLLEELNYSDLQGHCDPAANQILPASNYPDLILLWQYAEGILLPHNGRTGKGLRDGVPQESLTLQRSEFSRRVAKFIVAAELQTTVEYLTRLCRKWDPEPMQESVSFDL
jgi:hypothetical protein